jgi:hypothetical protein
MSLLGNLNAEINPKKSCYSKYMLLFSNKALQKLKGKNEDK